MPAFSRRMFSQEAFLFSHKDLVYFGNHGKQFYRILLGRGFFTQVHPSFLLFLHVWSLAGSSNLRTIRVD
jgi:hypothetical protein